jgi:hypothetical protein
MAMVVSTFILSTTAVPTGGPTGSSAKTRIAVSATSAPDRWGDAGGVDSDKILLQGKFVLRNNSVLLVDRPIAITRLGANATLELQGTGRVSPLSTIDLNNRGTLRLLNHANLVLSGQLENEGTLFIDGTSSLTADEIDNDGIATINGLLNADVTFSSSTDWKGSGIINGALVDGGSGTPGNSPGTFTVNGSYTQLASGRLLIELASPSSFDLLSVTGAASLEGKLSIALDAGFLPASADTFTFLTAANISGTFSNATDDSRLFTSDGLGSFLVSYDPDSVSLSHYVPIPEPSAVCLLLLTGTAAAFRRRRGVQDQNWGSAPCISVQAAPAEQRAAGTTAAGDSVSSCGGGSVFKTCRPL